MIFKPAMRIIARPTVQLRLDLQYPLPPYQKGVLEFVGIHRRHRRLLIAQSFCCILAGPLRPVTAFLDSPRRVRHFPRLLHGLSPDPDGPRPERVFSSPHPNWLSGRDKSVPQGGSHVHQVIDQSGRHPALLRQPRHDYAAAPSSVASPPLELETASESNPTPRRQGSCTANWPISTRLAASFAATERQALVRLRCTF